MPLAWATVAAEGLEASMLGAALELLLVVALVGVFCYLLTLLPQLAGFKQVIYAVGILIVIIMVYFWLKGGSKSYLFGHFVGVSHG